MKDSSAHNGSNAAAVRLLISSLEGGGAERVCYRLSNQWAANGVEVELIALRKGGIYEHELDPKVKYTSLGCDRTRQSVWRLRAALSSSPEIPVLVFGADLGILVGSLKRLGLLKCPVIYREGAHPSSFSPLLRRGYHFAISGTDGLIFQNNSVAEIVRRQFSGPKPYRIIPNPIVVAANERKNPRDQSAPDFPRVLSVGRLSQQKDFETLINAFVSFRKRWSNAVLTIVGEGGLRKRLEALRDSLGLTDFVFLPGFSDKVEEHYLTADLFVLSSPFEGQPNALFEAIICGCPVVTAGGESVREVLAEIGLADSYVSPEHFSANFVPVAERILAHPQDHWVRSSNELARRTEISTISDRYLSFLSSVASGRHFASNTLPA